MLLEGGFRQLRSQEPSELPMHIYICSREDTQDLRSSEVRVKCGLAKCHLGVVYGPDIVDIRGVNLVRTDPNNGTCGR